MRRAKITIVGAGNVGATVPTGAPTRSWATSCCSIFPKRANAQGQGARPDAVVADHGLRLAKSFGTSDYADTAGSDVVVITAGIPRKPGMSRDDLLATNAKIMTAVCQQVKATSPNAVVIVVSNPLDAMVQRALQVTGFPPQPRDRPGGRARHGPLSHVPRDGTGRERRRYLGAADGRPRRHDGAAAELHVGRRHSGHAADQAGAAWRKSSIALAMAAPRSSAC